MSKKINIIVNVFTKHIPIHYRRKQSEFTETFLIDQILENYSTNGYFTVLVTLSFKQIENVLNGF